MLVYGQCDPRCRGPSLGRQAGVLTQRLSGVLLSTGAATRDIGHLKESTSVRVHAVFGIFLPLW